MTTIPSQLPPVVTAPRAGTLQALALQSGQMLDAKVLGLAPNGGTQVEIRGQVLNLVLPMPVKAGDTIQLQVQGTGQQMKLALQQAAAPSPPASPPPAATPSQPAIPLPAQNTAPPSAPQPAVSAQPNVAGAGAAPALPPAVSQAAVTNSQPPLATAPTPAGVPPASQGVAPLYPQLPGTPNPFAVAAAATAIKQPAPAQTTAPGSVRPVGAIAPAGGATSNSLSGNANPPAAQALPTTPQAALAQMVQASVPRQAPVTDLTTALASLAGKVALPEPVARAVQQVLAGRTTIDGAKFDGPALQAAVRSSGVFQEASLVSGQLPLPQTDMKAALLTLRQTLTTWLGQQAPLAGVAQVAPPLKGVIPRARSHEAPPLDADAAPEEVGKQLLERTESALARTRLHQHASLPEHAARTADWSMDLPVLIGQHQATMQFQIHRDQTGDSEAVSERGWQMRFAINLPNMGEVGAQVSLRAGTTGVMLWASDPQASEALDAEVAVLREALAAANLRLGAVIVRHGEPHEPSPAPSGHFVDSRS